MRNWITKSFKPKVAPSLFLGFCSVLVLGKMIYSICNENKDNQKAAQKIIPICTGHSDCHACEVVPVEPVDCHEQVVDLVGEHPSLLYI